MTVPDTVTLRIERAAEHLGRLHKERSALVEQVGRGIKYLVDTDVAEKPWAGKSSETNQVQLSLYVDAAPSPRLPLIVSDFLQQLRSALDNLICALVVHRGNRVVRENAFPIAVTAGEWKRAYGEPRRGRLAMWHGISLDDLAILEELQPVHRSNDPESDPLAVIRRLSNCDKREALGVHYSIGSGVSRNCSPDHGSIEEAVHPVPVSDCGVPFGAATFAPFEMIRDPTSGHADVLSVRVTATGPDPDMRMDWDPPFDIAFAGANRILSLDDLASLWNETISIVERFTPAFL